MVGTGEPPLRGSGDGVGITEAEDVEDDRAKLSIDDGNLLPLVTLLAVVVVVIVRPADDS